MVKLSIATTNTPLPIRAAQYVRMSTEHQQYSPENQLEVIRQYAATHQMEIVREFLLGDIATAKKNVVKAWTIAKVADPGAHIRYASLYGAGLVEMHKYQEALGPLDEAIKVAGKTRTVHPRHSTRWVNDRS